MRVSKEVSLVALPWSKKKQRRVPNFSACGRKDEVGFVAFDAALNFEEPR